MRRPLRRRDRTLRPRIAARGGMAMTDGDTYMPESLDEVAALLLAADGPAPPVVTGTRVFAQARGPAGPTSIIVDLGRVPELNRVEFDERNGLRIGGAVSLADPQRFPPVQHAYALLVDVGYTAGLDRAVAAGTFGECLSSQVPSTDLALALICLGASVAIFGPHGWSRWRWRRCAHDRRGRRSSGASSSLTCAFRPRRRARGAPTSARASEDRREVVSAWPPSWSCKRTWRPVAARGWPSG